MKKLLILAMLVSTPALAEDPILPNPHITPGTTMKDLGLERLCLSGYTGSVRNVSTAKKKVVYELYDLPYGTGKYEVDHLISLELGGDNSVKNLWPESYLTHPWNAKVKDKLENKLHQLVCDNIMPMEEAQQKISTDWIKTYCEVMPDMKTECKEYVK
jgi:hypothetical protein